MYGYGLCSNGLKDHGLYSHDLYNYGLYSHDLYSYGLLISAVWDAGAYVRVPVRVYARVWPPSVHAWRAPTARNGH